MKSSNRRGRRLVSSGMSSVVDLPDIMRAILPHPLNPLKEGEKGNKREAKPPLFSVKCPGSQFIWVVIPCFLHQLPGLVYFRVLPYLACLMLFQVLHQL